MPEVTVGTGHTTEGLTGGLSVVHPPYPFLVLSQWTSAPRVQQSPQTSFSSALLCCCLYGASSFCKTPTLPSEVTGWTLPRWPALASRLSVRSCAWLLKAEIQQVPLPTLLRSALYSATFNVAGTRAQASPSQKPRPREGLSPSPWALREPSCPCIRAFEQQELESFPKHLRVHQENMYLLCQRCPRPGLGSSLCSCSSVLTVDRRPTGGHMAVAPSLFMSKAT